MDPDDLNSTTSYAYDPPRKEICWIVAGRLSEFDDYVRKKLGQYAMLRQECPYDYHYVSSVDSLRGHANIKGFFVGSWRDRTDIKTIQEAIAISKVKQTEYVIEDLKQGFAAAGAEVLARAIDEDIMRQLMSKPATGPEWRAVVRDGSIFEYLAKS